ncbi:MAG: magnesium transporter, partial [Blastocatellia bacterium]|nr:magnesium transporter [Blastocatellia bacterium]
MLAKTKSTMTPELLERLREQVKSNPHSATEVIDQLKAPDAAELLNELPLEDAVITMMMLPIEEAVAVFNEPSCERRPKIMESLEVERTAAIIGQMSSDERSDLVRSIDPDYREKLLPLLSDKIKDEIGLLLQFPPTTAGGIMSTEFLRLSPDSSVSEALNHVKATARNRAHIYSAYVLDDDDHLLGAVSLRDLVVASPAKPVGAVMRKYPIYAHCLDDQEKVARLLAKYNLLAVPVVDDSRRVLGFVTVDDALDVLMVEHKEDVEKLGGMEAFGGQYFLTTFWEMIRKRATWLIVLFLGELLTSNALQHYEDRFAKLPLLVLFIPLILSSGGNSGSQSATLTVRGLAVGEFGPEDWVRLLWREVRIGIVLGLVLGFIGFVRTQLWNTSFAVSVVVAITLVVVVVCGSLFGAALPLLLRRLGFDPAVSSTPFIASLVDVAGI